MHVAKATGWEEEQKGTMLGSPFSWPKRASALCAGTLGSTLEAVHWERNKGCYSIPHWNWEGHPQAQTPRWRGLGVYASSRWWQVRG